MNSCSFWSNRVLFILAILYTCCTFTFAGLTTDDLNPDKTPYCKVNKNLITISPGTTPGTVTISGRPEAITSTSIATVYAKNAETGTRANVTLAEDMSFTVEIKAEPGQKIRVYANNREGKRSYGTFNIENSMIAQEPAREPSQTLRSTPDSAVSTPQTAAIAQSAASSRDNSAILEDSFHTTPAVKEYSVMTLPSDPQPAFMVNGQEVSTTPQPDNDDPSGTNLAVVIMIVNTDTGQVLSTTQVTGKSKTYAEKSPENFKIMIQRILDRCKNVISSEILRPNLDRTPLEQPQN